jgi:O-antigen/teichoic acid export membrane protein
METVAEKLFKNTAISFVAKLGSAFLGVVSLGILTRSLGKEGFGEYSIILAYLYIFSLFADFGLYSLLLREMSSSEKDSQKIFSHIFFLRVVFLVVVFACSLVLIRLFPYSDAVKNNLIYGVCIYAFMSLNQIITAVFQKHLSMFVVAISEVLSRVFQVGFFVVLLFSHRATLEWFLYGSMIATGINFLILFFARRRWMTFSFALDKNMLRYLLVEAWPMGVSIIFVFVYFKMDSIILSVVKGVEAVGIYNSAYKIFENLIVFPAIFIGLVIPLLSKLYLTDKEQFKKLFQRTQDALIIGATPLVCGGIVLSGPVLDLVAGKDFVVAQQSFIFLLCALFFVFVANLYGAMVIILKKQKIATFVYALGAAFNFIANLYFIKQYSYTGAAMVTLATELLVTSLLFLIVVKEIGYKPSFNHYKKVMYCGFFMSLALIVFPYRQVIVQVIVGGAVYALCLVWLRVVTKKEVQMFLGSFTKNKTLSV